MSFWQAICNDRLTHSEDESSYVLVRYAHRAHTESIEVQSERAGIDVVEAAIIRVGKP